MTIGRGRGTRSDINVTPLIDVVLVLLIIFLLTMPLQLRVTPLVIPPPPPPNGVVTTEPIVVNVAGDLSVTLAAGGASRDVARRDLGRALRAAIDAVRAEEPHVFVNFDDTVAWREAVDVMDTVRGIAADAEHNAITVALVARADTVDAR